MDYKSLVQSHLQGQDVCSGISFEWRENVKDENFSIPYGLSIITEGHIYH